MQEQLDQLFNRLFACVEGLADEMCLCNAPNLRQQLNLKFETLCVK
jgi:hypothetical protein